MFAGCASLAWHERPGPGTRAGASQVESGRSGWAGPRGVRVNAVSPGMIDTDIHADLSAEQLHSMEGGIPLRRQGTPGETADAILFLVSDQSRYITGTVLDING